MHALTSQYLFPLLFLKDASNADACCAACTAEYACESYNWAPSEGRCKRQCVHIIFFSFFPGRNESTNGPHSQEGGAGDWWVCIGRDAASHSYRFLSSDCSPPNSIQCCRRSVFQRQHVVDYQGMQQRCIRWVPRHPRAATAAAATGRQASERAQWPNPPECARAHDKLLSEVAAHPSSVPALTPAFVDDVVRSQA